MIARNVHKSKKSIFSSKVFERSVVNGFEMRTKSFAGTVQIALRDWKRARKFTISRTWIPSRISSWLFSSYTAFFSIFLVVDTDSAAEDILFSLPVLKQFDMDTNNLFRK